MNRSARRRFESSMKLLHQLTDNNARLTALDSELKDGFFAGALCDQASWQRKELLLRMGGGKIQNEDEELLDRLISLSQEVANSGEPPDPNKLEERDALRQQIEDRLRNNDPYLLTLLQKTAKNPEAVLV
jgi:hypothetical protein